VKEKQFQITDAIATNNGWQILLKISTGNTRSIYISDILNIYTHITYSEKTFSQAQISEFIEKHCLTNGIESYVIPLLETFSDIEVVRKPTFGIRFITPQEQL
jgi:hypothetical protein